MNEHKHIENEEAASAAFDRQSSLFDDLYAAGTIIRYKRERVREHILRYLNPHSHILELNSGTGEDALFFARMGHTVHATDISAGMQHILSGKVKKHRLGSKISFERCSYTKLRELKARGPYDLILSNFAGLNCTGQLYAVLGELPSLLRPGGMVTLVLLPRFCLWEFLLLFKGKFRTATRRLLSWKGTNAQIEGVLFKCWYYRPSSVIKHLIPSFYLLDAEGLCSLAPPSYMEGFAEKHPRLFNFLVKREARLKSKWPWKYVGDYVILSFIRKN